MTGHRAPRLTCLGQARRHFFNLTPRSESVKNRMSDEE